MFPSGADPWRTDTVRRGFEAIAGQLEAAGAEVSTAAPASTLGQLARAPRSPLLAKAIEVRESELALLTGLGREASGLGMRQSYDLAQALWDTPFDLFLAPLHGGVAHALLMARATGEAFQGATVVIWEDDSSARRLAGEAAAVQGLDALIADAMERMCLRLADLIVGPEPAPVRPAAEPDPWPRGHWRFMLRGLLGRGGGPEPERAGPRADWAEAQRFGPLLLPAFGAETSKPRAPSEKIGEVVFVGPASRRTGLPDFLDAVEGLSALGLLEDRRVTFLGPMRDYAMGLSREMLGVRAQGWDFRFALVEAERPSDALAYLEGPGKLAVFPAPAPDTQAIVAQLIADGRPLVLSASHPEAAFMSQGVTSAAGPAGLTKALAEALGPGRCPPSSSARRDWAAALSAVHDGGASERRVASGARKAPAGDGVVTVCIAHKDRPPLLKEALASLETGPLVRAMVIDNGSRTPEALALLDELSGEGSAEILRLEEPVQQGETYNRAAARAQTEFLLFFDDDNAFPAGGVERLRRAMQDGVFDIVVSNLDVYDDEVGEGAPAGRMLFLGDAGSAGLFFNGFGDTSMIIRRAVFETVGGFDTGAASGAALDWVFLAKARALGLRIGVLQQPAVKYRRSVADIGQKWRKRDKEGALRAVLDAYRGAYDPELIARLAQGLSMGLI